MAFSEGLWPLAVVDIFAFLASACLLVMRHITLERRAAAVLLITFLVGVFVVSQAGFLSGGPAWLFCFAVMSGVFLGLRAALLATLLNALALTVLAGLSAAGMAGEPQGTMTFTRAIAAGANFLFLNAVLAVLVAVLVNGLQSLNKKTEAATNAFREERADLLRTREKLKHEIVVRMNSERALRKSEQKYRLLAENIQDVIWMMDMKFAFTFVSPSIERLQGWTPQEYLKLTLEELLVPASLTRVFEEFNRQYEVGRESGSFVRSSTLEVANLNDLVGEYLISPEYQRLRALHPRVEVETQLEPA